MKKENGWSMMSLYSEPNSMNVKDDKQQGKVILDKNRSVYVHVSEIYDTKLDKTMLYGTFRFHGKEGNITVKDGQGNSFVELSKTKIANEKSSATDVVVFEGYTVSDGKIDSNYLIEVNDKTVELVR